MEAHVCTHSPFMRQHSSRTLKFAQILHILAQVHFPHLQRAAQGSSYSRGFQKSSPFSFPSANTAVAASLCSKNSLQTQHRFINLPLANQRGGLCIRSVEAEELRLL